ncbi:MAG: GyrI-like domain-containing protein [Defluviitaleaceae bacterium]|nr:GyrI-like domain-containing protein [Defluviitaleaceae bacterium]
MEPKIVNFGPVKVAGHLHKCTHGSNTIPAFWGEVLADGRHQKLHSQDFAECHNDFGICFGDADDDQTLNYILGLAVKPGAVVPEEYHQYDIGEGQYAVLATPPNAGEDFSKEIQRIWPTIYGWLENNAEYAADHEASCFELYRCECKDGVECEACKTGQMVCEVYVAVKKK